MQVNLTDLQAALKRIGAAAQSGRLYSSGLNVIKAGYLLRVRSLTPVKTGRLTGGWSAGVSGKTVAVKNGVYYAPFVNYGHRTRGGKGYVSGRHFLERGFYAAAPALRQGLNAIIKSMEGR